MAVRPREFWHRISDGIAVQQLWSQFSSEARVSYRLYSSEVDWERTPTEKRRHRWKRVATGMFWAMVMKLSPGRRVLFVAALVLLVWPGFEIRFPDGEFQLPNLSFLGAIIFLVLLALELADRVTMKRDLEIAKEIQTWLMPAAAPQLPGFDIAFATRPANTVAGDYYDAFLRGAPPAVAASGPSASTEAGSGTETGDSCAPLLLIVADVAGKSVPAALLMATLQASLHTLAGVCTSEVELVERLNRYCCEQNVGGSRFTTAFLAQVDPRTRHLTYVNAGHNWPVLIRASGTIERLKDGGVPLGMLPKAHYECGSTTLAAGDKLVVFTDGLVEAEDNGEQEFGEGRMLATLASRSDLSATQTVQNLMTSVDRFVNSAPQHDDITCLVLRIAQI